MSMMTCENSSFSLSEGLGLASTSEEAERDDVYNQHDKQ